jgi:hypothetical protein
VLRAAAQGATAGATVFGYLVRDPWRYGVVEFDDAGPRHQPRGEAEAAAIVVCRHRPLLLRQRRVSTSPRADALGARRARDHRCQPHYLERRHADVERLGRGIAWLDTGTHESLLQASLFVQTIEERQGLMMACVEEIAYRMGYIGADEVARIAAPMRSNAYGQYLLRMIEQETGHMRVSETALEGVLLIEPRVSSETRAASSSRPTTPSATVGGHRPPLRPGQPLALDTRHAAGPPLAVAPPPGQAGAGHRGRDLRRRRRHPARLAHLRPTSWLFATGGPGFVQTILRRAAEHEVLHIVADQRGCPTWAEDLAAALLALATRPARAAIFHACGAEPTTWHGFATAIVDEARRHRRLACTRIEAIATTAYPTAAARPAYTVLDTSRLATLGITLPSWRGGLRQVVADELGTRGCDGSS